MNNDKIIKENVEEVIIGTIQSEVIRLSNTGLKDIDIFKLISKLEFSEEELATLYTELEERTKTQYHNTIANYYKNYPITKRDCPTYIKFKPIYDKMENSPRTRLQFEIINDTVYLNLLDILIHLEYNNKDINKITVNKYKDDVKSTVLRAISNIISCIVSSNWGSVLEAASIATKNPTLNKIEVDELYGAFTILDVLQDFDVQPTSDLIAIYNDNDTYTIIKSNTELENRVISCDDYMNMIKSYKCPLVIRGNIAEKYVGQRYPTFNIKEC